MISTWIPKPKSGPRYNTTIPQCPVATKHSSDKISHCMNTLKRVPLIHQYKYQHINLSCLEKAVAIAYAKV